MGKDTWQGPYSMGTKCSSRRQELQHVGRWVETMEEVFHQSLLPLPLGHAARLHLSVSLVSRAGALELSRGQWDAGQK